MTTIQRTDAPIKITKRTVDAAKPRSRDYVLWDTDIGGFGIKVLPSGRKSYLLKYRTKTGEARKPAIGAHGDITAAQARTIAENWKAAIAQGGDPKGQRDTTRRSLTFKMLADQYIENFAKERKRSWKEDRRQLDRYCKPWHAKRANGITPAEVSGLLATVKRVNGPVQANRLRACISKAFNWAVSNHEIPEFTTNPARDVERPARETERDRVYSEDEIKKLWDAFGQAGTFGVAFKFMLVTMQRRMEVMALPWSEITERDWTLPALRTKNKRLHVVPLSTLALDLLQDQQGFSADWVFPSRRGDNHITSEGKAKATVRELSGISDFRPHDLRRSAATESTRLGFSRFIVDRYQNHTEPGIGRVYDRYDYHREKAELAEAWARRLSNLVGINSTVIQVASLQRAG